MEVYESIWRDMGVYGGAPGAPSAADELMPSELYHQGGMRIMSKHSCGLMRGIFGGQELSKTLVGEATALGGAS